MLRVASILVAVVFIIAAGQSGYSATYTVTKTADTNDGVCDSDCSLREAIAAANATEDDDIIVFDPAVFGTPQTIVLSGTEMVIANNGTLTINGPGAHLLTLDGNLTSRIIALSPSSVVAIDGIRFTRGNGQGATNNNSGGALQTNGGSLTLSNSIVTGNQTTGVSGGIRNSGTGSSLTVINCIFSNNSAGSSGGALQNFSASTLLVVNSTFFGNSNAAGSGGAIQANGTSDFINTTFSGNSGVGGGGAISTNGAMFRMTNSTVKGNSSTTNGGGIHRGTTNVNGYIRNSIIAGNTGPSPDVSNSAGGLQSQGNNIIGAVGTSSGWVESDFLDTDPILGPYEDNGGFGFSYMPLAGSPAIDAGQNCVLDASCPTMNAPIMITTDQRGVARPANGTVDIGAVEVEGFAAAADISGTVRSSDGRAVSGALVTISLASPESITIIQTAVTNSFGNFHFTGITTGASYEISVHSKGLDFTGVIVPVDSDITGLEITATNNNLGERKR
jgi:CSLREA domain-containing protein